MDRQPSQPSVQPGTTAPWEPTHPHQQMAAQVTQYSVAILIVVITLFWTAKVVETYLNKKDFLFVSFFVKQVTFAQKDITVFRDPTSPSLVETEHTWTTPGPQPATSAPPGITVSTGTGQTPVSRATTAQRALGLAYNPVLRELSETPQDSSMKLSAHLAQVNREIFEMIVHKLSCYKK